MNIQRINGYLMEKLLYNGLANLKNMEERLNALNVFPVADGDTGSNMCLTLENGLRHAERSEVLGTYLASLNEGMLLGARGNSGVILSQLFNGIYQHLARCSAANCGDMRNAFIRGYKTAYRSVITPVEGTILTVSREGIESIRFQIDRRTTMEGLFSMYVAEMKKSLSRTTQLLPKLRESGVVDSGALGYIAIIEGMSKYLNGEVLRTGTAVPVKKESKTNTSAVDAFTESSEFTEGYCMEFLLRLMVLPSYSQDFKTEKFIDEIKPFGNSIVVTKEKSLVKVHIHTKEPAWVITISRRYGEFVSFKLENMQLQHNEYLQKHGKPVASKPLGIIAVASGAGLSEMFKNLGCDVILENDDVSEEAFAKAYASVDADTLVVLPNGDASFRAAEKAALSYKGKKVLTLPTKSVAEGYFAVSMDVGDDKDTEKRISNMKQGMVGVATVTVTEFDGGYLALANGERSAVSPVPAKALAEALRTVSDIGDKETCVIFRGDAFSASSENAIVDCLADEFPSLEVQFFEGGQMSPLLICGLI